MTDPVRLSKRLAELLPCSRREAELYIEGGWVTVDGKRVEEPQYRVTDQRIELLPGATPTTAACPSSMNYCLSSTPVRACGRRRSSRSAPK